MMRGLLVTCLALVCAACAQAPKAVFSPPDGHWWLAASAEQRDGFDIGFVECNGFMLGNPVAAATRDAVEQAITSYFQTHPHELASPVAAVIARLEAEWRRTGQYKLVYAKSEDEYTGYIWWQSAPAAREAIIEGFLACQGANQKAAATAAPRELSDAVNRWYGTTSPHDPSVVNQTHFNDKLGEVILQAERESAPK